jgi:hypothetical protein
MEVNCYIHQGPFQQDVNIFNPQSGYALPFYEGKYDPTSDIYFPVCKRCYDRALKLEKLRKLIEAN